MDAGLREQHPEALQEYFQIDSKMQHYNDLRIRTKNWSVTVGTATIAAGFVNKTPQLFLVAAASTFLFWLTEARYHSYQAAFAERQKELEICFLSDQGEYKGPQIDSALKRFLKRNTFKKLANFSVHLPHSILVPVGVLLFAMSALSKL